MISYYNEFIDCAFGEVPENIRNNRKFQDGVEYLTKVLDDFDENYIERDGEFYNELIYEAQEDGAVTLQEKLLGELKQAQYRRDLFGEEFDLDGFVSRVEALEDLVYG